MLKKTFINDNFRITVTTASRRVLSAVSNYLDFTGKGTPPPKMAFSFRISERREGEGRRRDPFIHPEPLMKAAQWSGSLALPAAEARVDYRRRTTDAVIHSWREDMKEPLLDFILFKPLRMIMARDGYFCLHASAAAKGDRCIITCGPQNSGKSTVGLSLAQQGFGLLCDDDCFIKAAGGRISVVPFPTKMGISGDLLRRDPALRRHLVRDYRYGGKERISLRHLYGPKRSRYGDIVLLFPRFTPSGKHRLRTVAKDEALRRLIMENATPWMWGKDTEGFAQVFFTFHTLVSNAKCFDVIYNDGAAWKVPHRISGTARPASGAAER